ncbi:MAG: hypothetical protein P8O05_04650 [Flavobacteriales bacterium]|nr:hypothetical protein [Flavobacteriales bacterium]
MIIQLENTINSETKEHLISTISNLGYASNEVNTQLANYLVCIGKGEFDIRKIG